MTIRVKLSETGEITLPQSVLHAHGWGVGTELELVDRGGSLVLRPMPPLELDGGSEEFSDQIKAFLAARPKIDRPFPTQEEIDRILLEEAARRFDATRD